MTGTSRGVLLTASRRIGIEVAEYCWRLSHDEKWCVGCRRWHPIDAFGPDVTRGDGRASTCRDMKNQRQRTWWAHRRARRTGEGEPSES